MRGMRSFVALMVLAGALLFGASRAHAQWATCTITATPVSFGSYDVFSSSDLVTTGSISYSCRGFAWTLSVSLSKGGAPNNNPRRMASGRNHIDYNLYLDAAHTQIWGDPNPNQYSRFWVWNESGTLPVYGLIPAGQDVPVGSYNDFVVATINF
jgi:spore coat protein U-like protein